MGVTAIISMSRLLRGARLAARGLALIPRGLRLNRQHRPPGRVASGEGPADGAAQMAPLDYAALLDQVRAALALVSQGRTTLTQQIEEMDQKIQLLEEHSSTLTDARSAIEERLSKVTAMESKLRAAEERLQQLVQQPSPDPGGLVTNPSEKPPAASATGGGGERTASTANGTGLRGEWEGIPVRRSGKWPWISPLRSPLLVVTICSVALGVLLIGVIGEGASTAPGGVPIIERVTLDPAQPLPGEPVTVRWEIEGADMIEIMPILSDLDVGLGKYTFASGFDQDTQLTFVATNEVGRAEKSVMIALRERTLAAPATGTPARDAVPDQSPVMPSSEPQTSALRSAMASETADPPSASPILAAPEPSPAPATSTPPPTAMPDVVEASSTTALSATAVAGCSAANTRPSGTYCDESGLFTVWVYACETLEMTVDWGDGATERYAELQIGESTSHQYSVAGTYDVLVASTFDAASCQQTELRVTYMFQYPSPSS